MIINLLRSAPLNHHHHHRHSAGLAYSEFRCTVDLPILEYKCFLSFLFFFPILGSQAQVTYIHIYIYIYINVKSF